MAPNYIHKKAKYIVFHVLAKGPCIVWELKKDGTSNNCIVNNSLTSLSTTDKDNNN